MTDEVKEPKVDEVSEEKKPESDLPEVEEDEDEKPVEPAYA